MWGLLFEDFDDEDPITPRRMQLLEIIHLWFLHPLLVFFLSTCVVG